MEFTVGADVEVPLWDGHQFISAIDRIGGTKHQPRWTEWGNLQEDNVLAEFAINPAESLKEFQDLIKAAKLGLMEAINPLQYQLRCFIHYPETELQNPKAFEFGCDPDMNAWTRMPNLNPIEDLPDLSSFVIRVAGGHVHVGSETLAGKSTMQKFQFAKLMDLFLGVPAVLLDNSEGSVNRRSYYGKAGSFRDKEYGLEYRTLSNFWIENNRTVEWVYNQVGKALDFYESDQEFEVPELCAAVINDGLKKDAEKLIKEYGVC